MRRISLALTGLLAAVTLHAADPVRVRFVRLDAEHAITGAGLQRPIGGAGLWDKIVLEVTVDAAHVGTFDYAPLSAVHYYARQNLLPVAVYLTVPEKRLKDRFWTDLWAGLKRQNLMGVPFPLYQDAGVDLPRPETLPHYRLVAQGGTLAYAGPDVAAMRAAYDRLRENLPPADPVFSYAKAVRLKEKTDALVKAGATFEKIHRALETEAKRAQRTDAGLAAEARHLMHGIVQTVERRVQELWNQVETRPGKVQEGLDALIRDWPAASGDPMVVSLRKRLERVPDLERLVRLEAQLRQVLTGSPAKPADVKRLDQLRERVHQSAERFARSKESSVQSEAALIQAELDNPPAAEKGEKK